MVGIVIVSHSEKVAEGVKELALQMAPDACIVAAGGRPDGSIGTDVGKIITAIEEVQQGDGVVILVDLGSAVMSSEMAIEMVENPENIKIVDGPLVEGAIVGTLEASVNSKLKDVIAVIEEARTAKKF